MLIGTWVAGPVVDGLRPLATDRRRTTGPRSGWWPARWPCGDPALGRALRRGAWGRGRRRGTAWPHSTGSSSAAYFLGLLLLAWWVPQEQGHRRRLLPRRAEPRPWMVIRASIFASNIGSEHLVGLAGSGATSWASPWPHYELHAWCAARARLGACAVLRAVEGLHDAGVPRAALLPDRALALRPLPRGLRPHRRSRSTSTPAASCSACSSPGGGRQLPRREARTASGWARSRSCS